MRIALGLIAFVAPVVAAAIFAFPWWVSFLLGGFGGVIGGYLICTELLT